LQKIIKIKTEKGQIKKVNLGWQMDREDNPINAPPIHVGALLGVGSLWPMEKT
jgi:hypothetical protein